MLEGQSDAWLLAFLRRTARHLDVDMRMRVYLWVMATPLVSQLYQYVRGELRCRRVTRQTDLLVEGFPRSANSYTAFSLQLANPGRTVSSHLHSSYSLKQAQRLGVPSIFLIREPDAAVASLMQMLPGLTPRTGYRLYTTYHRRAAAYLGAADVVTFDAAVNHLPETMRDVLERHGGTLVAPPDDPGFRAEVRRAIDAETALRHIPDRVEFVAPRPSAQRRSKTEVLASLSPADQRDRARAFEIYEAVVARVPRPSRVISLRPAASQ